jgi:hypothetical protein
MTDSYDDEAAPDNYLSNPYPRGSLAKLAEEITDLCQASKRIDNRILVQSFNGGGDRRCVRRITFSGIRSLTT